MRIAEVVDSSRIYGPGERTVVWLQGCRIRCENCWNNELWTFDGGRDVQFSELINRARANGDRGLTLLGGEPLDQAPAVLSFIQAAQEANFDILLYTGYELHELSGVRQRCVELADIVIHGRYVHELRSERLLWRGSTNQEILINSPKYHGLELNDHRQMEVHIDELGRVKVVGYPTENIMKAIESINGPMKSLESR